MNNAITLNVLKMSELSIIRLRYVNTLSNACLDSKVKYGCSVWSELKKCQEKELNGLKVKLVKRVLEVPYSTPSNAIKYEFGLTDMDLECQMEKVVLACNTLKSDGLVKRLLASMMEKKVPGFCVEVLEALQIFGLNYSSIEEFEDGRELREMLN